MTKARESAARRPQLEELDFGPGKRARLRRLLYEYGPGNGTIMLLPYDQGLEHGPVDFFVNPPAADPPFQLRLARDGKYSGVVFHIGVATKYMRDFAGQVPLVLKVNGRTNIPSEKQAFSPLDGSVEDGVRLGADAIGYTLYVGSPAQGEDIAQLSRVRLECERYGMPLIVWAYPRGEAVDAKGGRDTLYAIDYAARVALELGADIIKVNVPELDPEKAKLTPKPYNTLQVDEEEAVQRVVRSAGRAFVLFSGGSKVSDEDLVEKTELVMRAGATGLIFGRNMWQRPMDEALAMTKRLQDIIGRVGGEDEE
jgi:class I fructose-bisphosphate aldolase